MKCNYDNKKIFSAFLTVYFAIVLFIPFPANSSFHDENVVFLGGENLLILTNRERASLKIEALTLNDQLGRAAQMKADDMAKNSYFSHVSPAGMTPWSWFYKAEYKPEKAGENLALVPIGDSGVVQAWMNSPRHRENILRANFHDIGFGLTRGVYKGREVWYVVQLFGKEM